MNLEQVYQYCLQKPQAEETFPFDQDTLVFKVCGKMFALLPLEKWEAGEGSISLKCDPKYALELREDYDSIKGAYHMNKTHWNTIYLSKNEITFDLLCSLIDHSYDLVVSKLSKKQQKQLNINNN